MDRGPLTAERLRQLVHYDPSTGVFTRLVRSSQNMRVGDEAGTSAANGYMQIGVDGKNYYAHRLAVLYVTGSWPAKHVDHIDGVRNNNRWSNLREADVSLNQQNLKVAQSNNRTGFLGVSPSFGKFEAAITLDHERHRLGRFQTAAEAHDAYLAKKRELHPGCTI